MMRKPPKSNLHEEAAIEDPLRTPVETGRARHTSKLMAIDGVMGVAIGRSPTGDDAIVLYLRDPSVKRKVPSQVEGYPVETTVTGEIDAYGVTGRTS